MLILRSLPNVADTPANRAFREFFYSKWGKVNSLISAYARFGEYPVFTQRLSIKSAWGGAERYLLNGRTIAVDDDNYLVINDQRAYASLLHAEQPVHSFSIFFRPGFAEETLGGLTSSTEQALDAGDVSHRRPVEFAEHLRPHDEVVSPMLRRLARSVDAGVDSESWYEEQLGFLLERMLRAQHAAVSAIDAIRAVRSSTRKEIARRIGWSTDFIHTCYMRPLATEDLARSAFLSTYHYIRLFRAIHGLTPFAYLQRKRAKVARRLLQWTRLGQDEIARRVGFESRSTLFRQLRRLAGSGSRSIRREARATDAGTEA